MANIAESLTTKIGPLPAWAYGVVGIGGFIFFTRRKEAESEEVADENAEFEGEYADSSYMGMVGGGIPVGLDETERIDYDQFLGDLEEILNPDGANEPEAAPKVCFNWGGQNWVAGDWAKFRDYINANPTTGIPDWEAWRKRYPAAAKCLGAGTALPLPGAPKAPVRGICFRFDGRAWRKGQAREFDVYLKRRFKKKKKGFRSLAHYARSHPKAARCLRP